MKKNVRRIIALIFAVVLAFTVFPQAQAQAKTQTSIVVTNQKELNEALKNSSIKKIIIKTDAKISLNIKAGSFDKLSIEVDAPNASITNKASFKKMTITDAKKLTEKASGNTIVVNDDKLTIKVAQKAEVSKLTLSKDDAAIKVTNNGKLANLNVKSEVKLDIQQNGTMNKVTLYTPADITLSGTAEKKTSINVKADAEGASIVSETPIKLNTSANVDVKLEKGAEGSSVKLSVENVEVKLTNDSDKKVVVTDTNGSKETVKSGEVSANIETETLPTEEKDVKTEEEKTSKEEKKDDKTDDKKDSDKDESGNAGGSGAGSGSGFVPSVGPSTPSAPVVQEGRTERTEAWDGSYVIDTYNKNNQLIKSVEYDKHGVIWYITEIEYRTNGRIETEYEYFDGSLDSKYVSELDVDGKYTSCICYNTDGSVHYTSTYDYTGNDYIETRLYSDENSKMAKQVVSWVAGRWISAIGYDIDETEVDISYREYDNEGGCTLIRMDFDENTPLVKTVYVEDSYDRTKSIVEYGENNSVISTHTFEYLGNSTTETILFTEEVNGKVKTVISSIDDRIVSYIDYDSNGKEVFIDYFEYDNEGARTTIRPDLDEETPLVKTIIIDDVDGRNISWIEYGENDVTLESRINTYNSDGSRIEKWKFFLDGEWRNRETTFNSDDVVLEVICYDKDYNYTDKFVYHYFDEGGHGFEWYLPDVEDDENRIRVYTFDTEDEDQPLSIYDYYDDDERTFIQSWDYEYLNDGGRIETHKYYSDGEWGTCKTTFNDEDKKMEEVWYDQNDEYIDRYVYQYLDNGGYKFDHYWTDDEGVDRITVYTYETEDEDQPLSIYDYYDDDERTFIESWDYEYLNDGGRIETYHYMDEPGKKYKNITTKDENDRVLKLVEYNDSDETLWTSEYSYEENGDYTITGTGLNREGVTIYVSDDYKFHEETYDHTKIFYDSDGEVLSESTETYTLDGEYVESTEKWYRNGEVYRIDKSMPTEDGYVQDSSGVGETEKWHFVLEKDENYHITFRREYDESEKLISRTAYTDDGRIQDRGIYDGEDTTISKAEFEYEPYDEEQNKGYGYETKIIIAGNIKVKKLFEYIRYPGDGADPLYSYRYYKLITYKENQIDIESEEDIDEFIPAF